MRLELKKPSHPTAQSCHRHVARRTGTVSLRDEDRDGDLDLVVVAENEGADGATIRRVFARGPDGSFPLSDMVDAPLRP